MKLKEIIIYILLGLLVILFTIACISGNNSQHARREINYNKPKAVCTPEEALVAQKVYLESQYKLQELKLAGMDQDIEDLQQILLDNAKELACHKECPEQDGYGNNKGKWVVCK